jgi:hypothetical protein
MAIFYQMDEKSIPNRELYAETLEAVKRSRSVSPTENICGERHRAMGRLVRATRWCGYSAVSYTCFFGMKNIKAQYLLRLHSR